MRYLFTLYDSMDLKRRLVSCLVKTEEVGKEFIECYPHIEKLSGYLVDVEHSDSVRIVHTKYKLFRKTDKIIEWRRLEE